VFIRSLFVAIFTALLPCFTHIDSHQPDSGDCGRYIAVVVSTRDIHRSEYTQPCKLFYDVILTANAVRKAAVKTGADFLIIRFARLRITIVRVGLIDICCGVKTGGTNCAGIIYTEIGSSC